MVEAPSYREFGWELHAYIMEATERKPLNTPDPLRGTPFPPWGAAMAEGILDPKFRCSAWMDLANFCRAAGDGPGLLTCLASVERHLATIQDPRFKDTRTRHCLSLWLETGNVEKALDACRAMVFTEKRVRGLITLAEHFLAVGDVPRSQTFLDEAEAAAAACPKAENAFDGSIQLGYWYRQAGDSDRARLHFLKARDLLPRIKTRANRQRQLSFNFESLGNAETAAALARAIEDPKVQVGMLTSKAWSAKNAGRLKEARALLEEALPLARAAKGPKIRLQLEHEVASHFRGIGDLDRAEALIMGFEDPAERAKAFIGFADRFFFEEEARARFLVLAKRELERVPEGKVQEECQASLRRMEEPIVPTPEEEAVFKAFFTRP